MEKHRQMNERSLENLKLGAQARDQGKIRTNCTLLPETLEWLKKHGNASHLIDELVKAARTGNLKPDNLHEDIAKAASILKTAKLEANSANEQVRKLGEENTQVRLQLGDMAKKAGEWYDKAKEAQALAENRLREIERLPHQTQPIPAVNPEAVALLQEALKISATTGGAIKKKIRAALEIIGQV